MIPEISATACLPAETRRKVADIFTREEIKSLTKRSDRMGFAAIGFTWAVVGACFVAMAWASGQAMIIAVPVFILATVVIAGRQLSLAILQHDAAHGTLFKTRWLNSKFADLVCARAVWGDLNQYRPYHLVHHNKTATSEDPDLCLTAGLPTTRASLTRKFLRDLTGITGTKFILGRILMDVGLMKWSVTSETVWIGQTRRSIMMIPVTFLKNSGPAILMNGLLFATLWAAGHPVLYAMWVVAFITPFPLLVRIRSLAEHAVLESSPDMFRNTRTTRARFLARATVAPLNVNYHLEHHVLAAAPYFRLPELHRMLRERGVVPAPPGYLDVLKIVSSGPRSSAAM